MSKVLIDRSLENNGDDSAVLVVLPCGFRARFWLTGLSDTEYEARAKQIKELEEKEPISPNA